MAAISTGRPLPKKGLGIGGRPCMNLRHLRPERVALSSIKNRDLFSVSSWPLRSTEGPDYRGMTQLGEAATLPETDRFSSTHFFRKT